MTEFLTSDEHKPEARDAGRLDDIWRNAPAAIEDIELGAHVLAVNEETHDWTLHEIDRVRRAIRLLDAVTSRLERKLV